MCAHYLFDADFCKVVSGWEKGVVEKNVQDTLQLLWESPRRASFIRVRCNKCSNK